MSLPVLMVRVSLFISNFFLILRSIVKIRIIMICFSGLIVLCVVETLFVVSAHFLKFKSKFTEDQENAPFLLIISSISKLVLSEKNKKILWLSSYRLPKWGRSYVLVFSVF